MKPLLYYELITVSIPRKEDYTKIFYYKNGMMIGMKRKFDDDFDAPKDSVKEEVFDKKSYEAHLEHYQKEVMRLQNEFRTDLIEKYNMTGHPKANDCLNKAWEYGNSLGLWEVEDYFMSIIELFKEEDSSSEENSGNNIFGLMVN